MRPLLLGLVLGLAALGCGGDKEGSFDYGIPDLGMPSGCAALSECIAFCAPDAGTSCEAGCRANATSAAQTSYDAITSCVANVCSSATDDAGVSICADPSSVECMRCVTNSRYKTPAECTDAPSYCGACSTEQAACAGS